MASRPRGRIDAFIPVIREKAADHLLGETKVLVIHGGGAQVTECPQVARGRAGNQVGGELQLDKPVVGHVLIDCFDNPVAIAPGKWIRGIGRLAGRVVFAIAGDIHPVAAPAFPIMWRGQQPIDQVFVGQGEGSARNASISS